MSTKRSFPVHGKSCANQVENLKTMRSFWHCFCIKYKVRAHWSCCFIDICRRKYCLNIYSIVFTCLLNKVTIFRMCEFRILFFHFWQWKIDFLLSVALFVMNTFDNVLLDDFLDEYVLQTSRVSSAIYQTGKMMFFANCTIFCQTSGITRLSQVFTNISWQKTFPQI